MKRNLETVQEFNRKKNTKALAYTAAICSVLLLFFFLISWKTKPPAPPVVQDVLEINLGNEAEGFGEEQPLIEGETGPTEDVPSPDKSESENIDEAAANIDAIEDDKDVTSAPIPKVVKTPTTAPATKVNQAVAKPKPVTKPNTVNNTNVTTVPKNPKFTYKGPGKGGGNGADRDNGYTKQGKKPGGGGDDGAPSGNPDSYGKNPGGKIGGPQVIRGNRKIVNYPSFESDLPKATICADITVGANGAGRLIKLVKPSTSFNGDYATRIKDFLRTIKFNSGAEETQVTVRFNFTVQ